MKVPLAVLVLLGLIALYWEVSYRSKDQPPVECKNSVNASEQIYFSRPKFMIALLITVACLFAFDLEKWDITSTRGMLILVGIIGVLISIRQLETPVKKIRNVLLDSEGKDLEKQRLRYSGWFVIVEVIGYASWFMHQSKF